MSDATAVPSALPLLLSQGLGDYVDQLLRQLVFENRDTIHQTIDKIIALHSKGQGKGHVEGRKSTAAGGLKSSAPAYTLRDPKVTPAAAVVRELSVTSQLTRSRIEPLSERVSSAMQWGTMFDVAKAQCKAAVEAIVKQCRTAGKKFFDSEFYFDKRNNLYPAGSPEDCTVGEPKMCMRLQELYPNAPLIADGASANDILQGSVGDCFLIGAISATAANGEQSITDLFAHYDVACGVYGVLFFKDGGWEWVIVDDMVAVKQGRSKSCYPLFACPTTPTELWPCVLEKAYAKLHYNWDTIDGGWAREAIVDMTGGVDYTIDLYREGQKMTFKQFSELVKDPATVLGCAVGDHVKDSDATGNAGESGAVFGLFKGHQYGVLECKSTSDGHGFVCCRNPWGNSEWSGRYSDGSREWKDNPQHKIDINPMFGDDGDFWMIWEDFKEYMTQVDVVRIFDDRHEVLTLYGTGGGNCCYLLHVIESTLPEPFCAVLSQEDPKTKFSSARHLEQKTTPYSGMRLSVEKLRKMPQNADDVLNCRERSVGKVEGRVRSLLVRETLPPGLYALYVEVEPSTRADPPGFFVRVINSSTNPCALWNLEAPQKRLQIGSVEPLERFGVDNAIAGTRRIDKPAEVRLKDDASRHADAALPPVRGEITGAPASSSAPGATSGMKELQELTKALEQEKQLRQKIASESKAFEVQCNQANDKCAQVLKVLQQQQQENARLKEELAKMAQQQQSQQQHKQTLDALVGRSLATAHRDPSTATPYGMVGLTLADWQALLQGTFDIAKRGKKAMQTIRPQDAALALRTLVTAGLGIDDLLEEHALIQRGTDLTLEEFSTLSADVIRAWGFYKSSPS